MGDPGRTCRKDLRLNDSSGDVGVASSGGGCVVDFGCDLYHPNNDRFCGTGGSGGDGGWGFVLRSSGSDRVDCWATRGSPPYAANIADRDGGGRKCRRSIVDVSVSDDAAVLVREAYDGRGGDIDSSCCDTASEAFEALFLRLNGSRSLLEDAAALGYTLLGKACFPLGLEGKNVSVVTYSVVGETDVLE